MYNSKLNQAMAELQKAAKGFNAITKTNTPPPIPPVTYAGVSSYNGDDEDLPENLRGFDYEAYLRKEGYSI
jgi:hypothetical protein